MKFLTAEWRNLILAQYAVPEALVAPHLPPGVEPDRWRGECVASLVAFQFLNTRVLGVPWPGFRDFPEWNLRIYARREGRRGVVFVREFVPQRFVAWVARAVYNEPYAAAAMSEAVEVTPAAARARYELHYRGKSQAIAVEADPTPVRPAADSAEHFFKEHSWGYGQTRRGRLIRYEVRHPEWDVYPVRSHEIAVDWGHLYGARWAAMTGAEPLSVVLAAGSAVAVYPKGTLGRPGATNVSVDP